MTENRKFPRFNAPFNLKLSCSEAVEQLSASALDVSMSGVRVAVQKDSQISQDNSLALYFLFPQKTLEIQGKVQWVKDYDDRKELGVLFMKIPDAFKEDIYGFIFKYHRQQFIRNWWQQPAVS